MSEVKLSEKQMKRYFGVGGGGGKMIIFGVAVCIIALITNPDPHLSAAVFGIGLLLIVIGVVRMVAGRAGKPSDGQYDRWVDARSRDLLSTGLKKLRLDMHQVIGSPLCLHGLVLPGMAAAARYAESDVRSKKGKKDKLWRYSVNIFTFYLPTEHFLAVYSAHVSALDQSSQFEIAEEFPYQHIVGISEADSQGKVKIDGKEYQCRIQTCTLRNTGGQNIETPFVVEAVSNKKGPVFIADTDADRTIVALRNVIRAKQTRP